MIIDDNYVGDSEFMFEDEANRMMEESKVDRLEKEYMLGSLKWNTQFDGFILLSKMTEAHLMNTIDYLNRKEKSLTRDKWVELMMIELEKRK